MQDRNNPQRVFLVCIGNKVFINKQEPHGSGSQVRTHVSSVRKSHDVSNFGQDLPNDPVSSINTVRCNKLPYLVKIENRFWMESVSCHKPMFDRRAATLFSRK